MKTLITFIILVCSPLFSFSQHESTMKYIPINNVYGWENKTNSTYFNPDLCEQSYFSIKLTGFEISPTKKTKLWNKYSPFLYIKIEVGNKEFVSIVETANMSKTEWKENQVARSNKNLNLIGPFPYLGDDVKVTINLYAYKTKDNLEAAFNAISSFNGLFPNMAGNYIEVSKKVKQAIDGLLPNCKEVVSYSATWNPKQLENPDSPNIFKEGYYLIHPINQEVNIDNVYIKDLSQIRYIDANTNQYLFQKNMDYIVIEFEHFIDRRDFQTFPFFKKYTNANVSAIRNETTAMEKTFDEAMASLYANDNFTMYNKQLLHNRLYNRLVEQVMNLAPDYNARPTPVTKCTPIQNTNYQITTAAIREKLIEEGLIQPGEKIESLGNKMANLSNVAKDSLVFNLLEVKTTGANSEVLYDVLADLEDVQNAFEQNKNERVIPASGVFETEETMETHHAKYKWEELHNDPINPNEYEPVQEAPN